LNEVECQLHLGASFSFTTHHQLTIVRSTMLLFTALLCLSGAAATALTSVLAANEKSCYFVDVDGALEKIGWSQPRRKG
jgi:hypothetical protein